MSRLKRKETAMLLLPSAALLGLAFFLPLLQAKPKQTLTLASVTVSKVAETHTYGPDGSDVRVNAQFNYGQSLQERYLGPVWSMSLTDAYILDSTGKKHYMITVGDLGSQQSILPDGLNRDHATFPLWLRYFPKSAGKLTFHFTAIAHDGFKMPVSVVVRN